MLRQSTPVSKRFLWFMVNPGRNLGIQHFSVTMSAGACQEGVSLLFVLQISLLSPQFSTCWNAYGPCSLPQTCSPLATSMNLSSVR